MPTDARHIVAAYDEELKKLSSMILKMGGLAESQLTAAIQAVVRRDSELAQKVVAGDRQIDDLEHEIDIFATRLLALRQPMAVDLRAIVSALKLAADIERIGDYAKNVAKRGMTLNQVPQMDAVHGIERLGLKAWSLVNDVLDAYAQRDVDRAVEVWHRDEEVDRLYNSLFRELLTYMMEDARTITPGTHLLFMAKNLERIGDLATNMAETIYYLIEGRRLIEVRPKGDETSTFTGQDSDGGSEP